MSTSRRVAKNSAYMLAGSAAAKALNFVTVIIIIRAVSPGEYGVFAFARAFPQLFAFAADLGIEPIFIKELAVNPGRRKELFAKLMPLKAGLVLIAAALTAGALAVSGKPPHVMAVTVLLTVYILGRSSLISISAVFKGIEKMGYIAAGTVLESVALLVFALAMLKRGGGSAAGIGWLYMSSLGFLAVVVFAGLAREKVVAMPSFDKKFCIDMAIRSWPFTIVAVTSLVLPNTDMVMISFMLGDRPAAYYSACVSIIGIISFVQNSTTMAMFPALSGMYARDRSALPAAYEKAFKLVSVTGLPFCICGAAVAGPLLTAAYGAEYTAAKTIYSLLSLAYIFGGYASFFAFFAAAVDKQAVYAVYYVVFIAVNAALNALFMRFWNVEGVAVSTLVCHCVLILGIYKLIMKPYHRVPAGFFFRLGLALAAASGAAWYLSRFNIYAAVAGGGAVYLAGLFLFNPFSPDDVQLIKKILKISR